MGMPFWIGCCCTNLCFARNITRYHYRIAGDDCMEECLVPYGMSALAYCVSWWLPCFCCVVWPYFIGMNMVLLAETDQRGYAGQYLSPLPATPSAPTTLQEDGPLVVIATAETDFVSSTPLHSTASSIMYDQSNDDPAMRKQLQVDQQQQQQQPPPPITAMAVPIVMQQQPPNSSIYVAEQKENK
jgi:hypothetical protein